MNEKEVFKPVFTFETGNENLSTHPGPFVLAGYLTLSKPDTATSHVMAQISGEPAPDFETLKSQTPAYQSYNLKKDQAQWIPILPLEPETDYDIYVGVEHENGVKHMEVFSAKTSAQLPGPWHIVHNEQTDPQDPERTIYVSRRITVYEGQKILLPSIVDIGSSSIRWVETSAAVNVILSQGDYVTNEAKKEGFEEVEILTNIGNTDQFENAYFRARVTSLAKRESHVTTQKLSLNPQSILYLVDVVQ